MAERLTQVASAHQKIQKVLVTFVDGTTREIDNECIVLAFGKTEREGSEYRTQADTILSANMAFVTAVNRSIGAHVESWEDGKLLEALRKSAPEVADFLEKLFQAGEH